MRIDAHVHYWKPECGFDNRPVADHSAYRRDFLPGHLAPDLAAACIDGVILVQTCPQTAETDWLLALAPTDPKVLGVTAWVDLDAPASDFDALFADPRVVGIRAQLRRVADPAFVARPNVQRSLAAALRAGGAVTVLAELRHHPHLIPVVLQLPPGPITINHLGLPFADVDHAQWRAGMQALAARPDVYVQLSGLPFLFGEQWRGPAAHRILDDAFALFGPERLMFASDWPMMLRFATYGDWVDAVEREIAARQLSAAESHAIFAGTALRAHPRLRVPGAQAPSLSAARSATNSTAAAGTSPAAASSPP